MKLKELAFTDDIRHFFQDYQNYVSLNVALHEKFWSNLPDTPF